MRTNTCALIAALLCVACSSTETGNASTDGPLITLSMSLQAEGGGTPLATDEDGATFTFTTARAFVERIDFDLPDGQSCADLEVPEGVHCDSDTLRYDGGWVVDLVSGTSEPPLEDLALPAGRYKRVDVRFKHMDADDSRVPDGDPLRDHTLVATGTWSGPDGDRDFALNLAFTEDVRFETETELDLTEAAPATLVLGLDPAAWFSEAPIQECIDDGDLAEQDGVLQIDDAGGSCSDIENDIKEHMKRSNQLDRN